MSNNPFIKALADIIMAGAGIENENQLFTDEMRPRRFFSISSDFLFDDGRKTTFQISERIKNEPFRGWRAVAVVVFKDDKIIDGGTSSPLLQGKGNAIVRLARRYQKKSIPMDFQLENKVL